MKRLAVLGAGGHGHVVADTALAAGWSVRGRRRTRLEGALKVSIDFPTWRTLTRAGLSEAEAVEAGAGFVESAAGVALRP